MSTAPYPVSPAAARLEAVGCSIEELAAAGDVDAAVWATCGACFSPTLIVAGRRCLACGAEGDIANEPPLVEELWLDAGRRTRWKGNATRCACHNREWADVQAPPSPAPGCRGERDHEACP